MSYSNYSDVIYDKVRNTLNQCKCSGNCNHTEYPSKYPGLKSDLDYNGTYFPLASEIVFNLKTTDEVPVLGENGEEMTEPVVAKNGQYLTDRHNNTVYRKVRKTVKLDHPILTTVVTFDDGTKVEVRNSPQDPVTVIEKKLPDGSTVEVADDASKERGIVYAVIKRLVCPAKGPGYVKGGTKFAKSMEWLMNRSVDQNYNKAKSKAEKSVKAKNPQPKKQKKERKSYTNDDVVQLLGKFLDQQIKTKFL